MRTDTRHRADDVDMGPTFVALTLALASAPTTETSSTVLLSNLIAEDLVPTIDLFDSDTVKLRVGGLLQVHSALYVGEDSLVDDGDIATRAGFRLRRGRIGFAGRFMDRLGIYLAINLLEGDEDVGVVSDAKMTYQIDEALQVTAGLGKVTFSRAALDSSSALYTIERPFAVRALVPSRRLGLSAEGQLFGGALKYGASVLNASEGFVEGNRFGGFLYGGRVEAAPLGPARRDVVDHDPRVSIGGAFFYEDGASANTIGGTADLLFTYFGAALQVEALCNRLTPDDAPVTSPGLADRIDRCGVYAEASWLLTELVGLPITPAARVEWFDDDRAIDDAGDLLVIVGGVNAIVFPPYVRAQLSYQHRRERSGVTRDNDSLVLNLQGKF
ncbi:MAG: porin [Deltaproteobacteria bacterium]